MAAFSSSSSPFQQHFLIDSYLQLPNSSSAIDDDNNLLEEPNNIANSTTQFTQLPLEIETSLDHSPNVSALSNNEPSVFSTNTNNMDSSSIVTVDNKYDYNTEQVIQKVTPVNCKKRKCRHVSVATSAQSKDMGEVKEKKKKKMKDGEKQNSITDQEPPTGYIHVRARRGQATDSHSLAERVRRERISERMKLLQALVPGCDKITGKALMLDEIINYVQSLQHQVELLSSKLASVNTMSYDFGMDLESFVATPNQNLSSLPSTLPSMHQCSPKAVNNYPFLDNSANSILFQQAQVPNGNGQGLWEVDEQRQTIINQSGFSHNNLFSFH